MEATHCISLHSFELSSQVLSPMSSLPSEIILKIFSHLRDNLYDTILVNRQWRSLSIHQAKKNFQQYTQIWTSWIKSGLPNSIADPILTTWKDISQIEIKRLNHRIEFVHTLITNLQLAGRQELTHFIKKIDEDTTLEVTDWNLEKKIIDLVLVCHERKNYSVIYSSKQTLQIAEKCLVTFSKNEQYTIALLILKLINDSNLKQAGLTTLALDLIQTGDIARAKALINQVSQPEYILIFILKILSQYSDIAWKLAMAVEDPIQRSVACFYLFKAFIKSGQIDLAAQSFQAISTKVLYLDAAELICAVSLKLGQITLPKIAKHYQHEFAVKDLTFKQILFRDTLNKIIKKGLVDQAARFHLVLESFLPGQSFDSELKDYFRIHAFDVLEECLDLENSLKATDHLLPNADFKFHILQKFALEFSKLNKLASALQVKKKMICLAISFPEVKDFLKPLKGIKPKKKKKDCIIC